MFGKAAKVIVNHTIKNVYTIFDKIGNEMGNLMIYNNDEQAKRAWFKAFENAQNRKEDFIFVRLGTIDINTMVMVPEDIPVDITPEEVAV